MNEEKYFDNIAEAVHEEQQYQRDTSIDSDVKNLLYTISAFKGKVNIRHLCTKEGYGYFAVYNEEMKRFVPSEYRPALKGIGWHYRVWIMLYFGQEELIKYLKEIETRLKQSGAELNMEIRLLYAAFLLDITDIFPFEREKEEKDGVMEYIMPKLNNYKKEYEKEIAYYQNFNCENREKSSQTWGCWYEYYNEGLEEFDIVRELLDNCVNEIYKKRDMLERCALWKKSKDIINALNNMIYERADFQYLKYL